MDDDRGLQQAFQAAFVEEISDRRAELAIVSFDNWGNDKAIEAPAAADIMEFNF